jgi:hypothetical protein
MCQNFIVLEQLLKPRIANRKGFFVLLSIHMNWVCLDEFKFQTSQKTFIIFLIPSNLHEIGITEQVLKLFLGKNTC